MEGWREERMDEWVDERMNGQMEGWMDGRIDEGGREGGLDKMRRTHTYNGTLRHAATWLNLEVIMQCETNQTQRTSTV
jgi:hypothetical protein